jgi:hypothetical protein
MRFSVLIPTIIGIGTFGYVRPSSGPNQLASSQPPQPQITELPVPLTVKQRSTTEVPGSSSRLSITVDDITREQVMVGLVSAAGSPVLAPVSMTVDEIREF